MLEENDSERLERKQREGEAMGVSVVGAVVVNAGQRPLVRSQAAKLCQLVSLCVTDLIDHKLYSPHLPPSLPSLLFPFALMIHASCIAASHLKGQRR